MVLALFLTALAAQSSAPSACSQAVAVAADAVAVEICAGEDAARQANVAPKETPQRRYLFESAAEHFRKAVNLSSGDAKIRALNLLIDSYDVPRLNAPERMEQVLRELIQLTLNDLAPMYRLARLQEDRGFIDAAEDILLNARRQQPNEIEPYKMLVQFYARRVTAMHKEEIQAETKAATGPGERDENGVFRVGGPIAPPARLDVPRYPADAQATGVKGVVVAEIMIDESGNVSAAKIVQSIPLLDDAALQAVRNWHYVPTLVNGTPVPVKTTVTVNFTLPSLPPTPRRR